jgi:hypothetical protein
MGKLVGTADARRYTQIMGVRDWGLGIRDECCTNTCIDII